MISSQYSLHHLRRLHAGEFLVEALEWEGEFVVIEAEEVEDGGVKVTDVDGIFGNAVADAADA